MCRRGCWCVRERKTYLLCIDNIHDHTALQHACKACLYGKAVLVVCLVLRTVSIDAIGDGEVGWHGGDCWLSKNCYRQGDD